MRWFRVAVTVSGLALVTAACSSTPTPKPRASTTTSAAASPATNTVKIALEGPMSGPQAVTGLDMLRGAQLAATSLNATGGVLGKHVEIVPADDQADPTRGVAVAHQMIREGVRAVVGPFNSSVGVKVLPLYRAAGIPILRLTSVAATEGFGITTQPMQAQIAPVEAQAMTNVLHARSVAILYDPSTYTAAVATQLQGLLKKAGVAVPVMRSMSPSGTAAELTQRTTSALDAVAATKPSITYLAMYGPQAGAVVAAMHAGAAYGRCFVDLAAQGSDFTAAAGASGAACLASGVPPPDQLPGGPSYVSAYLARFHVAPGTWGAFSYDSVELLAQSALRAQSWRADAVRNQLGQISGYQGVTGTITITMPSGNRMNPPVVILDISPSGTYGVDPTWAAFAGYRGVVSPTTTTTAAPTTTTTTAPPTTTTTAAPTTTTTPPTTAPPRTTTTTTSGKKNWSGKTVAFGAVFSTSGVGRPVGTSQVQAAKLAVRQINAAGGLNGARVKISYTDDASDPQTAATDMSKLAREKVLAVLGPTFSNSAAVADPVADDLKLPVLAVSNTGAGIVGTCAYPCSWIFRDSLGEATAIPVNIDTYVAKRHPKTAVVLAPSGDPFGAQTGQVASAAFVADKVLAGPPVIVPPTEPALDQAVVAALASKPSVLAITASAPAVAANIIVDARRSGFTGGIVGGNVFNSPTTATIARLAGKGAQSGAGWYAGDKATVNKSFIASFRAAYHHAPDQFAAQAYTGVKLLAAAARTAPLTFSNVTADRSRLKHSLEGVSLRTPLGPFHFTAEHDVSQPVWVVAMNGKGGYSLVKKVPASQAQEVASSSQGP